MPFKPLNILIADDEPLMRGLLTSYLFKECNHKMFRTKDGKEALTTYQNHHSEIDLILLDLDMPKMNGFEVLEQVRKINPNAYVVIISGIGTMEIVKKAIAAGVNGFIAKPYTNCKIDESLKNYYKHMAKTQKQCAA